MNSGYLKTLFTKELIMPGFYMTRECLLPTIFSVRSLTASFPLPDTSRFWSSVFISGEMDFLSSIGQKSFIRALLFVPKTVMRCLLISRNRRPVTFCKNW